MTGLALQGEEPGTNCSLERRDGDRQAPSAAEGEAAGGERWSCRGVGAGGVEVKVVVGQLAAG
jgi:hypothetical protein